MTPRPPSARPETARGATREARAPSESERPPALSTALRAARPLAHANIAPPLLLGQALAYRLEGRISIAGLLFALAFGVLDHLFIVFANDYADRHADTDERTLFSGGSGVLPTGLVRPETLGRAAAVAGAALCLLSLAHGPTMFALALVAVALVLAYSYPPLRLSYRGGGEWLQGLGVGLILPLVGYYAQSSGLVPPIEALAGPVLLAAASNVVTATPDLEIDARADKRTIPVRLGRPRAADVAMALTLAGAAITVLMVPIPWTAAALIFAASALPLAGAAIRGPGASREASIPWVVMMSASHQATLLGVTAALFFGRG